MLYAYNPNPLPKTGGGWGPRGHFPLGNTQVQGKPCTDPGLGAHLSSPLQPAREEPAGFQLGTTGLLVTQTLPFLEKAPAQVSPSG